MAIIPLCGPSCKQRTCKNSSQVEFQDGPECGNKYQASLYSGRWNNLSSYNENLEKCDTFQTPSRYYLDTTQTPSDNFQTPKDHCSQFLSNPSGGWVGCAAYVVGGSVAQPMWWVGGLHVHNHATSWPNLQVETCKLELNLS